MARQTQLRDGFLKPSRCGRTAWSLLLVLLPASLLLCSCISKNLRQARQMMAENHFDKACYWYDEAIAELVPTNSLKLERRKAYTAASKYHITAAYQKLSKKKIPEALAEAKAAKRCAAETSGFDDEIRKLFDACAESYAQRAALKTPEKENDFKQSISDFAEALKLTRDSVKTQQYSADMNNLKMRFAGWLKNQGRLSEAASYLADARSHTSDPADRSAIDKSTRELEQIEEEIEKRLHDAETRLTQAEKLLQKGEWEKAISSFREVREMNRTLEKKAKYGERRAREGQAKENIQEAIRERKWDETQKWLKQWRDNGGRSKAAKTALFIEGGRKSDALLAQASEQIRQAMLGKAEELLKQAREFEAFDLPKTAEMYIEIENLKNEALKAADDARELALQARIGDAKSQMALGEDAWKDWSGWAIIGKFVSNEESRIYILGAAQEDFENARYGKACEGFRKAIGIRYDVKTDGLAKTCEAWVSSNSLLSEARAEMEKKNLWRAVNLAEKAVRLKPENTEATALLDKAKHQRSNTGRLFKEANGFFQNKDWREAVRLLEQCVSMDASHHKAAEMLKQAKENLLDEWGISYNPDAAPAHVLLRHWLTWLLIFGMMATMVALRKSAYVRFGMSGSKQLGLRKHLLEQKWWRNARIAASAIFVVCAVSIIVVWIVYESGAARLSAEAHELELSGELQKARETHQFLLETKPLSHRLPSSRLAVYEISSRLPEPERVPVQNRQTGLQNWFHGSRRAVSPYSIDYGPMLIALASLAIIAFLISFRLKKRLLPRFFLVVFAIPPFMVLMIEFFSTQSVGTGSLALPLSAFSRYIPFIAANASFAAAVVLCFLGSDSPAASMLFLSKRKEDRIAAREEKSSPLVVGKTREALLKEELPWLPASKPPVEDRPETEKKDESIVDKPSRKKGQEEHTGEERMKEHEEQQEVSPPEPAPEPFLSEDGSVMAADDVGKILRDPEPQRRIDAAKALGALGDARALEPLIDALNDSDERVREAAGKSLEKVGKLDIDLLKIAHKKEKDAEKKSVLQTIIANITGRTE